MSSKFDNIPLIKAIKNNTIPHVNFVCAAKEKLNKYAKIDHSIEKYKYALTMIMQHNTSIHTLNISINYTKLDNRYEDFDGFCLMLSDFLKLESNKIHTVYLYIYSISNNGLKSLCEGLTVNRSINYIYLEYRKSSPYGYELLNDMLKNNIYLTSIYFGSDTISIDAWTNIMESLIVNNTLKRLQFSFGSVKLTNNNNNGLDQLLKLLKFNKTITNLNLSTNNMITYTGVISALKENPSILSFFCEDTSFLTNDIALKLAKYSKRNFHNSKLKAKMLQDL
jgi:hypothetical protein